MMNAIDCPTLNDADVRRLVGAVFQDRLRAPSDLVTSDSLMVDVWCPKGQIIVSVARPGQTAARVRRFPADDGVTDSGRTKTIALAIAELVSVAGAPKPVTIEPEPPPTPTPPPAPPTCAPADDPTVFTAIGPAGGTFLSGDHLLGGAEIRWSSLFVKSADPESHWAFGMTYALDFLRASFWDHSGHLSIESLAVAWLAQLRVGRFRPEIALGDRLGVALFDLDSGFPSNSRQIINGPFLEVGFGFVAGRMYARASAEVVLPAPAPGSFCTNSECVTFQGILLLGSVKLGLAY